jgi:hypothetical protein
VYNEPCEIGPIRPPSEAYSLLFRATRNCPWGRCRFCPIYGHAKFSLRPVEDLKREILAFKEIQAAIIQYAVREHNGNLRSAILAVLNGPPSHTHHNVALWMSAGAKTVFLQDANPLIMRTPDMVAVLKFLRQELPSVTRVNSFARSHTAVHKTHDELKRIHEAGLDNLHIGLESGSDTVLKVMDKGVTAAQQIEGGQKVVAAGITLSETVLLGLGGQGLWREHALETAWVINAIRPHFIRIRSLAIYSGLKMCEDIESGAFIRQTDEAMVEELRVFIENLDCTATLTSDHIGNMLQEVEGTFPQDKEKMLGVIRQFQSLAPEDRLHFMVGRRAGIYTGVGEMEDRRKHHAVAEILVRLRRNTGEINDDLLHELRLRYT